MTTIVEPDNHETVRTLTGRPLLQVEELSCERSEIPLFSDLSFSITQGEIVRISGPNGSGKTTLLRAIAGIHRPVAGRVVWELQEMARRDPATGPKIGYIGHTPGLRGEMTAHENLEFYSRIGGRNSGKSPMQCLETVGAAHCASLPCARLSAGQRQRVALARLCLKDNDLWLLDEPATSLDGEGVDILQDFARRHLGNGGLVVYSSHQPLDFGPERGSEINLADFQGAASEC